MEWGQRCKQLRQLHDTVLISPNIDSGGSKRWPKNSNIFLRRGGPVLDSQDQAGRQVVAGGTPQGEGVLRGHCSGSAIPAEPTDQQGRDGQQVVLTHPRHPMFGTGVCRVTAPVHEAALTGKPSLGSVGTGSNCSLEPVTCQRPA